MNDEQSTAVAAAGVEVESNSQPIEQQQASSTVGNDIPNNNILSNNNSNSNNNGIINSNNDNNNNNTNNNHNIINNNVCNQINDLHTLFDDSILSSYEKASFPQSYDQKTSTIFTLLNYNYLCDDQIQTQQKESAPEQETKTSIIYRSINCLIHQPVGLIVGPVCAAKRFQTTDPGENSHLYSDIVMLDYNSGNCLQQNHCQQLTEQKRPKFKFNIDKGCGIWFAGQILQMIYSLDERATLFVAMNRIKVKCADSNNEDIASFDVDSSTPETVLDVKQGTIRLYFDSDSSFSIVANSNDEAIFTIQLSNKCVTFGPNETGFGIANKENDNGNNLETNRWRKVASSPPLIPEQVQYCNDPDELKIDIENKIKEKSKSKNSLGPSLIRIRSLPQVYSNSNYKYQSILNGNFQYSSPTSNNNAVVDKRASLKRVDNAQQQINVTENKSNLCNNDNKNISDNQVTTTSNRPTTRRSAYRQSDSINSIKTNNKQMANVDNNNSRPQQNNRKKGLVINIKYKEDKQSQQGDNKQNSNNNNETKSNRLNRIHNYSAMKNIIKSSNSMIIVNKVPISFLSNYQASRRSIETGFGLRPTEDVTTENIATTAAPPRTKPKPNKLSAKSYTPFNNGNSHEDQTPQRSVFSKRAKRTEPMPLQQQQSTSDQKTTQAQNEENLDIYNAKESSYQEGEYYNNDGEAKQQQSMDNNSQSNKWNNDNNSIETTKKMVVYDIQKSVQYLKLINDFLIKHQGVSKEEEKKIKMKFDKYREKLREQLLKTVDSIEKYINDEDDTNKTNNAVTTSDQEFFYGIIDKIMKLISSLEFDVFRMISKEIIGCLVEINEKFFENDNK